MRSVLTQWEKPLGGSVAAEHALFQRLAIEIMAVQQRVQKRTGAPGADRALHAKQLLGVANARFEVLDDIDPELCHGFIEPGASYRTVVRLSNASGVHQADAARDLRGAALRIFVSDDEVHDLLMTNFPVSHARDAKQFVAFTKAMSGSRLLGIVKLMFSVGPGAAVRMLRNVLAGSRRLVGSLAEETFWSRGAILWGDKRPVRFFLHPADEAPASATSARDLTVEIGQRLAKADVVYTLSVQLYVDEHRTPVEDAAADWTQAHAPPVAVARLVIPRQDIHGVEAMAAAREVNEIAFNPWHTTPAFRPLGNINRARKAVYRASAGHRLGHRFLDVPPWRNRFATDLFSLLFKGINRIRPWHKLPVTLSLLNLSLLRHELRARNLIDMMPAEAPPRAEPVPPAIPEPSRTARRFDGTFNDVSSGRMGAVGAAFGRNLPPDHRPRDLIEPNPVTVSRQLLYRERFIPATTLNILAAAWIQFQVHDWVQHRRYPLGENDLAVPMPDGETWQSKRGGKKEPTMRISGDIAIAPPEGSTDGWPLMFANSVSHWWDASEVYGIDEDHARRLLEPDGPNIRLDGGYLPVGTSGAEITGFNESWWLGLSVMHTLFAREHNAVCDALRHEYPDWHPDRVFHTARLVVAALIAKIHTVEWTPAILATEAIDVGLNANWSGAPRDWLTQLGVWLTDVHALKGIPETRPDHHAVPYALTEDFVSVYRMHPLLPDDYRIFDGADGGFVKDLTFMDLQGGKTDEVMRDVGLSSALYSLGIAHPGAITLHNYPRALQKFDRGNGEIIDLSVVDIMRERSRGIPRYNAFRTGLHRPRARRWEDITDNPESVRRLRDTYRSVDDVDAMVGLLAETPPAGFGFSDTAFRIFILMASRRLQSDRFLTVDFRPEVYSPLGIDWVQRNGMTSVILRHAPEFAAIIPRAQSAFAPWRPLASSGPDTR